MPGSSSNRDVQGKGRLACQGVVRGQYWREGVGSASPGATPGQASFSLKAENEAWWAARDSTSARDGSSWSLPKRQGGWRSAYDHPQDPPRGRMLCMRSTQTNADSGKREEAGGPWQTRTADHRIKSPHISLFTTIIYNTRQHSTTRTEGIYERPRSPHCVVHCCRELVFVEFKGTRSAPRPKESLEQ